MNISIAFSPNWYEHILVELHALFTTNKAPIKVYLLSDQLFDVPDFGDGYEVESINMGEIFDKAIPSQVNVSTRFTKYSMYRLLLPALLKEDKVLYIDADALVVGDISGLYNIDMGDNLLVGCIDLGIAPGYKESIGLSGNDPYLNAGVILMNLAEMRRLGLDKQMIETANTKYYLGHDQCILNTVCKGKIITINNGYNSSMSTGYADDIKIIHYAGPKNPWIKGIQLSDIWYTWEETYVRSRLVQ